MRKGLRTLVSGFRGTIVKNCSEPDCEAGSLNYLQNRLFATILIYLLPFSLFAIVPGVIMSVEHNLTFLAYFDSCIFFVLLFISFKSGLSVFYRKVLFILVLYAVATLLLYFLGTFGPGLLYLLSACVFTVLIFTGRAAYWSVFINTVICVVFAFIIALRPLSAPNMPEYSLGYWIAVSSNLILLSLVVVALFPVILKGLQASLNEQKELRKSLKNEQQALRQTLELLSIKNKELEEFAFMTSHDLQEPLRMVHSFLGLLEKNSGSLLDEKSLKYLHLAKDGAERMKITITTLLKFSLAEKKQHEFGELDLNALLNSYVETHKDIIAEKKVKLIWKNLPSICADELSMLQLFQNLIGNAIKYQKKGHGPEIAISCIEQDDHWHFSVSDNGIGIPQDQTDKVFIIFKRLHSNTEYPGTGIGLAICKKIIDAHSGKIWVESKPGNGSTFHFTIAKNLN